MGLLLLWSCSTCCISAACKGLTGLLPAASTPYEGGRFRMKLVFSPDYPQQPPKGATAGHSCYQPQERGVSAGGCWQNAERYSLQESS